VVHRLNIHKLYAACQATSTFLLYWLHGPVRPDPGRTEAGKEAAQSRSHGVALGLLVTKQCNGQLITRYKLTQLCYNLINMPPYA
jgi:hypothetical protein